MSLLNFIRRTHFVAQIYNQLAIGGFVTVGSGFHLGLGSRVWAPSRLAIGDDVYIGRWCSIECDGEIGRGTLIANNVGIVGRRDHNIREVGAIARHSGWVGTHPELRTAVFIGPDCWIGFGAIVLGSVTIGASSVVAAGAVVVNDVPANVIVAGNPAVIIGERFSPADLAQHWMRLGIK